MSRQEAGKLAAVARRHLDKVLAALEEEPLDIDNAVTWAFYAFENGVAAIAASLDKSLSKVHKDKARFAKWLHDTGAVSLDVSARLEELNDLRKDVQYGGPALDPSEIDFEDMARELERFLDEVDTRIRESPR